jgi:hypothetical protein
MNVVLLLCWILFIGAVSIASELHRYDRPGDGTPAKKNPRA